MTPAPGPPEAAPSARVGHRPACQKGAPADGLKLCGKGPQFARAYRFPGAHRTSNALDRLMNHQDRRLYAMRYRTARPLPPAARHARHGFAVEFPPLRGRTRRDDPTVARPFHDLRCFEYRPNWLHNLLIASSMGGRKL